MLMSALAPGLRAIARLTASRVVFPPVRGIRPNKLKTQSRPKAVTEYTIGTGRQRDAGRRNASCLMCAATSKHEAEGKDDDAGHISFPQWQERESISRRGFIGGTYVEL